MLAYIRKIVDSKNVDREEGASAVEYGLLVAAIAAVIIVVVFALGSVIQDKFSDTCKGVDGAGTSASSTNADCN